MKKNYYTLIFAQNYVTYHSSMYAEFYKKSKQKSLVVYLDEAGKSNKIEKRWQKKLNWGINLTKGFKSILIKNYAKDPYSNSFFSRINLQIPYILYKVRPARVFFQGYSDFSSWLILYFSFLFGIKSINWKGERVLQRNEIITSLKKNILKYFFFSLCNKIFYSCKGNLEYLKKFNIKKSKLFPMNCSVNNNYFQNKFKILKYKKNIIKNNKNFKNNIKLILVVSNFEKRKNIKAILEILPFAKSNNFSLVLVGSGNYFSDIEQYKKLYRDNLNIVGFVDISKISEYYLIADLFILLSEYDPSPKTLNEALNFGIPCIVSENLGTSKDLIKDGINGFILKEAKKYKIYNYVKRILNEKNMKQKCISYNKELLKLYSPTQNANILFKK
mgnify:FL=1